MADSTDVATVANEKDVGAPIGLLGSPLQPAAPGRQAFQVDVVGNLNHEVDVLWVVLPRTDGANEADSPYTSDLFGEPHKFLTGVQ